MAKATSTSFAAEMAKWTENRLDPDNPDAQAWIFYGDGQGHFRRTIFSRGIGFHEARVADLNGDGLLDVLDKPYTWETPRVDIWLQVRGAQWSDARREKASLARGLSAKDFAWKLAHGAEVNIKVASDAERRSSVVSGYAVTRPLSVIDGGQDRIP